MPSTAERTSGADRLLAESTAELLRLIPAPLLVVDRQGVVALANAPVCELLATGRETLVGRPLAELAEDDPAEIARMLALFASTDGWLVGTLRLRRADGVPVPFPCKGTLVQRPLGGRAALVGIELDHHTQFRLLTQKLDELDVEIRRRRDAEERLRVTTAAYRQLLAYNRSLIEASLDPLVTISPAGVITDVNRATEEATGLPRERLIGTDFADYFTEPGRARSGYREVLARGLVRDYPLELRHASGRVTPVLYNATVYRNEAGELQGVFAAARDVTERRRVEEALLATQRRLEESVAELERSNRELEQFAYVASHDLQEPLRMVSSYTQLLAERYGDRLDQDARDFIAFAVDGAKRMQRLIQDLLAYSRVTSRGLPFSRVDSEAALAEALGNLQASVAESGARVTHDALPPVLADARQLAQVFQNLVGNGLKFHKPGQAPQVHVRASRSTGDPPRVTFAVRDDGIGVDPKYFDRLFVLFQRLHTRQEYPGTGVGLALCKRIVQRHGGRIWMESAPGEGTTCLFELPAADPEGGAP